MRPRERVLRIVILILGQPYRFTRRNLAERFNISKNTLDRDLRELERAGIDFAQDQPLYK